MDTSDLIRTLIRRVARTIAENERELTFLDQAIGDGDHGSNLRRGADSVLSKCEEIAVLDFSPALRKIGMTLVMTVGGASGPLYGSAFIAMAKAAKQLPADPQSTARLMGVGVKGVKIRGRSDIGAKTMLDVLIPVQRALQEGADISRVRKVVDEAVEATRPMQAKKGRAAFLGVRSIGHIDPGAKSSALILHAICDVLEKR